MKNKFNKVFLAGMLGLTSGAAAAYPNLVVNGGFEQGSTGWTKVGMSINTPSAGWTHSGAYSASTSCSVHECVSIAGSGSFVGQTITTVAGTLYDLSFWVGENGAPTSELSVFWNGAMIADVVNPANYTVPNRAFVQYSFKDLLATGTATSFEIHGRQTPATIVFDDVVVTHAASLPEPGSLALLGLGVAGLIATRRARKNKD